MSQNLRKLFNAFEGNTKRMAWFAKQYASYREFVQAVSDANWKPNSMEKGLLDRKAQTVEQAEKLINDGAAARKLKATADARDRANAASVGHAAAKQLLQGWFELNAEYKARGYDQPDLAPVDLSYLEMGTSRSVGDAKAMGLTTFAEDLLAKEPLMIFSRKAGEFLAAARKTLVQIQGEAGRVRTYKDSIAEVQRIVDEAQKICDKMADAFSRSAPKPKPMAFAQQNMVPTAKDLVDVQRTLSTTQGINTPSQAWAMVGADKKGQDEKARFRAKAIERLQVLNSSWGTSYKVGDLDKIMKTLVGGRITTNYFMSKAPGANLEKGDETDGPKPTPLVELLMSSKNFKNVWETGKSQASTDKAQRGGVEEAMGYSAALNRTGGTAQTRTKTEGGSFDPQNPSEMPKYAAVTSEHQKDGVAARYGKTYIVWKKILRQRTTHTPGDSWNMLEEGVGYLTSGNHPEVIFANANEMLVRLAAAVATGQDSAWLKGVKENGLSTDAYIETQVHGDLTWNDVKEIVVGEDNADEVIQQLLVFAQKEGYSFKVRKK